MNRGYRREDFEDERRMSVIALLVVMVYGAIVGILGTLGVQWLLS